MKRLIRFAARLYPSSWRARYDVEFEALLDDTSAQGRVALDVLGSALMMQARRWRKAGPVTLLAAIALLGTSWWISGHPYNTPGTHQIFRMDSTAGALVEFLVLVIIGGVALFNPTRGGRTVKICAAIIASYVGLVVVVSLLTPQKIVSMGDSYCWDLWCVEIQSVSAAPSGPNSLYTAQVRIFTDSNHVQNVPVDWAKQVLCIRDERGHYFPILPNLSLAGADVALEPGQSIRSSLAFLTPADAGKLYLSSHIAAPPWVRLSFASDLNPFHRPTILRIN